MCAARTRPPKPRVDPAEELSSRLSPGSAASPTAQATRSARPLPWQWPPGTPPSSQPGFRPVLRRRFPAPAAPPGRTHKTITGRTTAQVISDPQSRRTSPRRRAGPNSVEAGAVSIAGHLTCHRETTGHTAVPQFSHSTEYGSFKGCNSPGESLLFHFHSWQRRQAAPRGVNSSGRVFQKGPEPTAPHSPGKVTELPLSTFSRLPPTRTRRA